ncbi:MAG: response regulator [Elusimicrobia bacterium]|nr:response regulator [Elusimicrobiota bacterium]
MRRVLVVEDEPDFQSIVRRILEPGGFAVEVAGSAEEAWERLAQGPRPDVAVVDWNLPGEDGISLCRRIRKDARLAALPLVLLTVRSLPTEQMRGLNEAQADLYLTKPIDPEELLTRVETLLGLLDGDREEIR